MQWENKNVRNWASLIDDNTIRQAEMTARLPILAGPVALMADAHLGKGSTVGSVIPTRGAVIPACVGVDVGCGMAATLTTLTINDLADNLDAFMPFAEQAIPAGVGKGHDNASREAEIWMRANKPYSDLGDLSKMALTQFGTLGSGNHFFEVCLDQDNRVWLMLHSGSRGVGNKLAQRHITIAGNLAKTLSLRLEDPDLAYLTEGTPEFQAYIGDLLWAQSYAAANRGEMLRKVTAAFFKFMGRGQAVETVNCHHNFTQREDHLIGDRIESVWITRKGAVQADKGRMGILPGSMGTGSFIVRGLGNPDSYNSSPHGAGRKMSRGEAKRTYTAADLETQMAGKSWLSGKAESLIDEIPSAYKDVQTVIKDSSDLVEVVHSLTQVLNYKGC